MRDGAADDVVVRQRPELRVEQRHVVTGVNQRPADRQQPERRQLLPRDAAPDRRVRRVHDQHAHVMPPNCPRPSDRRRYRIMYARAHGGPRVSHIVFR
jgi:hypothetical protein